VPLVPDISLHRPAQGTVSSHDGVSSTHGPDVVHTRSFHSSLVPSAFRPTSVRVFWRQSPFGGHCSPFSHVRHALLI